MKSKAKFFTVQNKNSQFLVLQANNNLRIVVTQFTNLCISHQIFTQSNLNQVQGASFKRIQQMFNYLQSVKKMPQKWMLIDSNNLTIAKNQTEVLKISLKVPTDPIQINKIILLKVSLPQQQEALPALDLKQINEDISTLKNNYNTVGVKLKGIGELFESTHQKNQANTKQIQQANKRLSELQSHLKKQLSITNQKINSLQNNTKQEIKRVYFELDIAQKNMLRNYATYKEETDKSLTTIFSNLKDITQTLQKNNLPKIRKDMDQIYRMFELQIKVNNYQFTPESSLFKINKKLHWISNKIIKNLQDVKDYNKVIGTKPFAQGISKFRIAANSIKNNGLMIGICTKEVKANLQSIKFNDHNLICLNSCGYIVNRGGMVLSSIAKIKSKDVIKILVNKSQGLVRWFCNDMEVAVADMGSFSKQEIYPIVGLGYFNDQVQILQHQEVKTVFQHHQTYTQELERLNSKFGRSMKN